VFLGQLPSGRFVAVKQLSGDAVQAEYTSIRLESDLPSMESIVGESASVLTIPSSEITILGELGKGSFGTVHLGKYQDSFCAVKTLTNQSKSAAYDFINEATLMHSLKKHMFLVEMMGLCMEAGKYSVVMEFCPRGNVESFLRSRMSERKSKAPKLGGYTLFKLMYGIALGMEHLSGQGVCHRDLAARNVLLDERLFPKISDFGFSRKLDTGKIKGKTQSSFGPMCVRLQIIIRISLLILGFQSMDGSRVHPVPILLRED
jgi:serine/threonine protein kinase